MTAHGDARILLTVADQFDASAEFSISLAIERLATRGAEGFPRNSPHSLQRVHHAHRVGSGDGRVQSSVLCAHLRLGGMKSKMS